MGVLEMDGMTVDQIIYWWDEPVVYLGRVTDQDDRPCLVALISNSSPGPVYHRMRFADEKGLRATLASGCAATAATYRLAQDVSRLAIVTGDEDWIPSTVAELLATDGDPTSLPPGRSKSDVPMARWGQDHWTLLRYLRSRHLVAAGADPVVEYQRLRINPDKHNAHAVSAWPTEGSPWTSESGTRLKGYEEDPAIVASPKAAQDAKLQIGYHDDIDCIEEFEAEGLLDILSTAHGIYRMTPEGIALCETLEAHVATGMPLDEFGHDPENEPTTSTETGEKE